MKLYKALKRIKKECMKHQHCAKCKLRIDYGKCLIMDTSPDIWFIEKFKKKEK